jgi:hypothetical protein
LLGFGHTQICAIFPKTKVRGIMPFSPGFNLSEALDRVTLSPIIEGQTVLPVPAGWTKIFGSPEISISPRSGSSGKMLCDHDREPTVADIKAR